MTLFNARRLIDSSYLVGGIHTVQVKIKAVIVVSHWKITRRWQPNFIVICYSFAAPFCCRLQVPYWFLAKASATIFLSSQCVNLTISHLASYDGYVPVCRMFCSLFGLWLTRLIVMPQEIQFYKSVFVPVCRFRSSKELKTNFKQTRIHCAQVQHYYLKISGVMLRGPSISRILV